MKKGASLARKIILTVSLTFLVLFSSYVSIVTFNTYNQSLTTAENSSLQNVKLNSQQLLNDLNFTNETLLTLAQDLSSLIEAQELTDTTALDIMKHTLENHEQLASVTLIVEKHKTIVTKKAPMELYDVFERFYPRISRSGTTLSTAPVVGFETRGEGDYYLTPKETLKPVLLDPRPFSLDGKNDIIATISYPLISESNEFLGVVAADFSVTYLAKLIDKIKPPGGFALILSTFGKYVVNGENPKLNLQPVLKKDEQLLKLAKQQKETQQYGDSSIGEALQVFVPAHPKNIEQGWAIVSFVPKSYILSDYYDLLLISIISGLVILAIIVISNIFVVSRSLKPISYIETAMNEVANGNLTQELDERRFKRDEIGALAYHFNQMVHSMKNIVSKVDASTNTLANSADELTNLSNSMMVKGTQVVHAMQEISKGSHYQADESEKTHQQTVKLGEKFSVLHELVQLMENLSSQADQYNRQGVKTLVELKDVTTSSTKVIHEVNDTMTLLVQSVKEIDSVIQYVNSLSDQTNLLSLNASIEAARAGEQGKGFAVVAAEVRKLAEQSKQATEQIQGILATINTRTKQATVAMQQTIDMNQKQNVTAQATENTFQSIASVLDEFVALIRQISDSNEEMLHSQSQLFEAIANVTAISEEAAAASEEVSQSTLEQQTSISQVDGAAQQLAHYVSILKELVAQFQLDETTTVQKAAMIERVTHENVATKPVIEDDISHEEADVSHDEESLSFDEQSPSSEERSTEDNEKPDA